MTVSRDVLDCDLGRCQLIQGINVRGPQIYIKSKYRGLTSLHSQRWSFRWTWLHVASHHLGKDEEDRQRDGLCHQMYVCMCSAMSDSWDSMNCSPPGSLSVEFSRQQYWSGLPFPTLGDLPNPEIEPVSLVSPRWILYHRASWEAHMLSDALP